MLSINQINGVPLLYDRADGDRVVDFKDADHRNFMVEESFYKKLRAAFDNLARLCPYGMPSQILTAGMFVNRSGFHGKGRAFDLDGLRWKIGGQPAAIDWLATDYKQRENRAFYLALQAVFMRHFGVVLGWEYNTDHHDHFHMDDSRPVGWRNSRSVVTWIQAASTYIYDEPLEVDGIWGPRTSSLTKWLPPGVSANVDAWKKALEQTAMLGFQRGHNARYPVIKKPELVGGGSTVTPSHMYEDPYDWDAIDERLDAIGDELNRLKRLLGRG